MNPRRRVRHWLVGVLAVALLVVVWRLQPTVVVDVDLAEAAVSTGPEGSDEQPRVLPLVEASPPSIPAGERGSGPVAPLTGLPVGGWAAKAPPNQTGELARPALFVKVDNHPRARPQTSLDQADIVFDLRAEGVTRFAAVFHSQIPDPVGPVRSSRTSDFDLVRGFNTPLYASSGGNQYVTAGLRELPIVEMTNRTHNEYFRDFSRPAPHNLYVMGSDLYDLAPSGLAPPTAWFRYLPLDEASTQGQAVTGPVRVAFTGSPVVSHTWEPTIGGWLRSQDGRPHLTATGEQLAPENVVIVATDYRTSRADASSPEVVSTGEGAAWVLTDGRVIEGAWSRPTPEDGLELLTDDGDEILLTPGRTWVLMPEEGQTTFG